MRRNVVVQGDSISINFGGDMRAMNPGAALQLSNVEVARWAAGGWDGSPAVVATEGVCRSQECKGCAGMEGVQVHHAASHTYIVCLASEGWDGQNTLPSGEYREPELWTGDK